MQSYHKINGLYKRYTEGDKKGKFILGQYSKPEFNLLKDIKWVWTEKLDGTNIRIIWNGLEEKIEFRGKTDKAEIPNHLLSYLQLNIKKELFKEVFIQNSVGCFPTICLYGEGLGYKIQNGCKYFGGKKEVDFILFDILIGNIWLKREDVEKIAKQLNLKIAPIVGEGTINEALSLIKSKTLYSKFGNKDFLAEGIVIKPGQELKDRMGRRIISKIKHKDFME